MKGIKLCAECADYDKKKHRCRRGAIREDDVQNTFYDDCPLPDVMHVVRCKECKYRNPEKICEHYRNDHFCVRKDDDYCSFGEMRATDE